MKFSSWEATSLNSHVVLLKCCRAMGGWASRAAQEEFDILTVVRFLSWGLKDLLEQNHINFNMTIDDMTNKLP